MVALEAAQFDESVAEMPHGLYSIIGEDGVKLSGGQRQRLSLARAFYREAECLFWMKQQAPWIIVLSTMLCSHLILLAVDARLLSLLTDSQRFGSVIEFMRWMVE